MGLINLKTNLTSLKYGNDRQGGGSSNQPYIQKDIPEDYTNKSPDFLLRNGILAPKNAIDDVSRLSQMFFDLKSPQGLLFIAKQNLLSRSAVATEASAGVAYGTSPLTDWRKAGVNEGIYTPLSTIAQAGAGFLGGHLNKQGLDPTGTSALSIRKYSDAVGQELDKNRLTFLLNNKFPQAEEPKLSSPAVGFLNKLKAKASDVLGNFFNLLPEDENVILKYNGGPGSKLGIGNTIIRRAVKTGITNPLSISDPDHFFGQNRRQPGRTEKSWKDDHNLPIGASTRYFNISDTNDVGKVQPNLTADGGITFEPNFITQTTKPNSLDVESSKSPKQAVRPTNNGLDEQGVKPIGVSDKYYKTTGELSEPEITSNAGYTYEPNFITKTTQPDSLDLEPSKASDKAIRPSPEFEQTKTLGLSNSYNKATGQTVNNEGDNNSHSTLNQPSVYERGYESKNPEGLLKSKPTDNPIGLTQQQLSEQENNTGKIKDFRVDLERNGVTEGLYNEKNYEQRVKKGDPGIESRKKYKEGNIFKYKSASGLALDKINALAAYSPKDEKHKSGYNDLVKFRIAILGNGGDSKTTYLHFRAHIDSFNDAFTSGWNSFNYVGRGEKFHNYNDFDRKINMGFTAIATSKAELIPMYKKLNFLASSLAPDYSNGGFMKGNIIRLTVGGYIYEQPGFLTSLTYDIDPNATWEIGIDEEGGYDSSVKELPHMIKVTGMSFTPIHNFLPSRIKSANGKPDQRFISLSNGFGDNKNNY